MCEVISGKAGGRLRSLYVIGGKGDVRLILGDVISGNGGGRLSFSDAIGGKLDVQL